MKKSRNGDKSPTWAREHNHSRVPAKGEHVDGQEDLTSAKDRDTESVGPEAGYKKPPRRGRWTKGKSGNPKGRVKGSKNKRTIIIEMMEAKLGRKIPDPSKLTRFEGMFLKHMQKALGGDIRSFSLVLAEYRKEIEAAGSSASGPTTEEDQQAYHALYEKLRREIEDEITRSLRVQIRAEILAEMKKGRP